MGSLTTTEETRKGKSPDAAPARKRSRVKAAGSQVGEALRTAYQQVVDEEVPTDFQSLLDKLS